MYKMFAMSAINYIQDGKTKIVNKLVSDEDLKKILHKFIDSQTEYTKAMTANVMDICDDLYKHVVYKDLPWYK
jgi:hypothetical protein